MRFRTPVRIGLTVLSYVFATFAVQGTSHFAVNAAHYAAIPIMRTEPVVVMGFISMLIQGTIAGMLFPIFERGKATMWSALTFSWTLGAFLASYIVLGEAGKYAIPSIPSWITVEGTAAFLQYTLFGVLLGWIHGRKE